MKLRLPALHAAQAEIRDSEARFRVVAAGRRFGKTLLGSALCIAVAARGGRTWWVAPSYKMAAVGWRGIRQLAAQIPLTQVHKVRMLVTLPSGGTVQVRSADDPQSLRGEGLDFCVLDECAFMREEAWAEALRPALSDRQGGAMFISTPKGRNWFWRLYQRGQDEHETDWASWQRPTSENPYIAASEIADARHDLPERIFAQEYEAQFLEDAGSVFRGVMAAATAQEQESQDGRSYVMGVDWGKHNDFTVISVMDSESHAMVTLDRFNQIDYAVQRQRLMALAQRYRPDAIMAETNAMGEPIIEQLQRDGLPVRGFTTTQASKLEMIESLALAFEREDITILNDPTLVGELQAYEMERLPSGRVRYNAPQGMHDDCVMSLALAWQAIGDSGPLLLWG